MPETARPDATRGAAAGSRDWTAWLVGLACLVVVVALYYPATRLYFVGDDIWFVRPNPHWFRDAMMPTSVSFHYYPINQILLSVLPALTGYQPEYMHVLNFLLCAGIGLGLFLLLRKLGAGIAASAIAAGFCLTRGVNYEVIAWITELSYILTVVFTLFTASWWESYLRGQGRKYLMWTVAGFAAAVLTIEHAMLLLPLYWLMQWLPRPVSATAPRTATVIPAGLGGTFLWVRRQVVRFLPFVLVIGVFFVIKLGLRGGLLQTDVTPPTTVGSGAPMSGERVQGALPAERMMLGFLNTPRRAYLDLLLSTSYMFFPAGTNYAAEDTWLTRRPWLVLVPWLAAHVLVLWKGTPLARFLLIWMYLYLLPLAVGSMPQARYFFMPTLPAAGLVGLGLVSLHRRLGPGFPRRAGAVVMALLLAALVYGEGRFIRARLREWKQASELVQLSLASMQRDLTEEPHEVYLMNFPRGVPSPFWTGYAFVVATEHLPVMLRPPRPDVKAHAVYDRSFVADRWPTVGVYATEAEVREKLARPGTLAYQFLGRPPWIERLR